MALDSDSTNKLIAAAIQAKQHAYSRYSKFRVGAALLAHDDTIVTGANVENASYGATICAERTAIVKAVSEGMLRFKALAVTTDLSHPVSPCGMCRQVLREFCALDMPIYLVSVDYKSQDLESALSSEQIVLTTIDALLPLSFGPEHLEFPRKS